MGMAGNRDSKPTGRGRSGEGRRQGSTASSSASSAMYRIRLLLCSHAQSERTIERIAMAIICLMPVNWNSIQASKMLPIPIRAAREVGDVLQDVPSGRKVCSDSRRCSQVS